MEKNYKMENEFQKMQRLAGVPVTEDKKQLDENFVGMSMVGNIFDREKVDYELAYEHYLGKLNENEIEEEDDQNNDESSSITRITNDWMKLIKTISDLIIKQKTADFPDKIKLHKQINTYGNQKVALETQLIDALARLNQNAGLNGNNDSIKLLLTQRSYTD
jgi:hypothetical protein